MTEGLIISMLLAIAIAVLAYKMRSTPVMFISSLGWMVSGLQIYQQTGEVLPVGLAMMLAFSQFFLINGKERA